MITVDEAMNHARNELERAFEKWLTDECPSGDCESVQEQWDDSFAHQELVDELQPVMVLTWEVHQLREKAANDSIQIELLEHKLESFREENERQRFDILAMNQSLDLLREENERLKADAERIEWQPIETAPKDEPILVGPTKRMGICVAMNCSRDGWVTETDARKIDGRSKFSRDGWVTETCVEWVSMYTPTHWMPLPEPPK